MVEQTRPSTTSDRQQNVNQEIERLILLMKQYEADMRLIDRLSQTLGVGFGRIEELYETVYDEIRKAFPVDAFYVALADPEATTGYFPLLVDNGIQHPPQGAALGPLLRWILERGEALLFDDVYAEAKRKFDVELVRYGQERKQARSWLGVPMMIRGQVKGVMSVQSFEPGLYGAREKRLLGVIANQTAVAIENSQLFQQAQQTLEQLSTPIVPVHDEILVVPLIGAMDTGRASRLIDSILTGIEEHEARIVIIDITGVPTVNSSVAYALLQAARAARLLGTQTVLTGLRPTVAEIIVELNVDLSELVTRSDLQAGIEYALEWIRHKP